MDPVTNAIVAALSAGAVAGLTDTVKTAVTESYTKLKDLLTKKHGKDSEVVQAVEKLEARPESKGRQEMLQEEIAATKAEQDEEIVAAAKRILTLVQPQQAGMGKFTIQTTGHAQGQTVGDYQQITQNFYLPQDNATSSPTKPQRVWSIPFPRNTLFLGQEDLLTCLHTRLQQGTTMALTQTQAISGLGGIGKTQIAIEYAYLYRDTYPFVFWVRAEHRETLMSDLVSLAGQLQLAEQHESDQMKIVTAVKQWLATHQDWLLIFDNADDVSLLTSFLPGRHTRPLSKPSPLLLYS